MKLTQASTLKIFTGMVLALFVSVSVWGTIPTQAEAVVYFGGPIGQIIYCINSVTYVNLGAPRGGPYLYSPRVTTTYAFGPPSHSGQYLLGAAGPTYFCLQSVLPLIMLPGLLMLYTGSSQ
jgi:hypothetical protein